MGLKRLYMYSWIRAVFWLGPPAPKGAVGDPIANQHLKSRMVRAILIYNV